MNRPPTKRIGAVALITLTLAGIAMAFWGTGMWHWISWGTLSVPIAVTGWNLPQFLSRNGG